MKQMLNNLYVTNSDVNIGRDGQNIVIFHNGKKHVQFPVQYFENIICFNYTGISPRAIELCLDHHVGVSFLSPGGKFLGKIDGKIYGNVLLRYAQYQLAEDDDRSLEYAKLFMQGKLFNSLQVIQRAIRDYNSRPFAEELIVAKQRLVQAPEKIEIARNEQELLGIEGDFSRNYFRVFQFLILQQQDDFKFIKREKYPSRDPVNAMLSFAYGLIRVLVENALTCIGLDPYIGFYHKLRPGRASLALDMMEELRAYMGDRFVLSLINRRQIHIADFHQKPGGEFLLTDEGRKIFIDQWQKRLQEKITHPYLKESIPLGLIPYSQGSLLARSIRKDIELYPPFLIN